MIETRCPQPACEHVFAIASELAGHRVICPACGSPLTARPDPLWQRNRKREALIAEGRLSWASPPREDDLRRQRRWLYHPAPEGATSPELATDPMYESTIDRSAPLIASTELVVVLDDVRSRWNVGSIFRTADALRIHTLYLTGITPTPPSRMIAKTALGAENTVPWQYRASVVEALDELDTQGYELLALELTDDAENLFAAATTGRCALVLGNEVAGVSAEALARCKRRLAIPMAGHKSSLNVAIAFGIAGFHIGRPSIHGAR